MSNEPRLPMDDVHSLLDLLRARARHEPAREAFTFLHYTGDDESEMTYAELDARARRIAQSLRRFCAPGERAVLLYPPGLDYVSAFFGCLYAGVIAVPAYPPDPARLERMLPRLQAIVADAGPSLMLTTEAILSFADAIKALSPEIADRRWLATDTLAVGGEDEWYTPAVDRDSLAFLQYTSGSTGQPKGVMLSHGNLLANLHAVQTCFQTTADSRGVIWLPPYHDMGLIGGILQPIYAGFPVTLMSPLAFLAEPSRWLKAISRFRGSVSGGPNFAFDLCTRKVSPADRASLDLSHWKVAFNGSEPIRADTLQRFADTFASSGFRRDAFLPCYGLAEATLLASGRSPSTAPTSRAFLKQGLERQAVAASPVVDGTRVFVSSGHAPEQHEILVSRPDGIPCAPCEVGEIWLAGPSVAGGYWRRPEETQATFGARRADTGGGPYLRTGDLGFRDRDGQLFVTGRIKDMIIIRGVNRHPDDIERSVERAHPGIRRGACAAFGIDIGGEEQLAIMAELSPAAAPIAAEVVVAVRRAVMEDHDLRVGAVVLLEASRIPKTSSGKIRRSSCRAAYFDRSLPEIERSELGPAASDGIGLVLDVGVLRAASVEDRVSRIVEHLRARVARGSGLSLALAGSSLDAQSPLPAWGLDSLGAVELAHEIERELAVRVPMTAFIRLGIEDLARDIANRLEGAPLPVPEMRADRSAPLPLSHGQEALWFLHQLESESSAYNVACALRIRSSVDSDALEQAFGLLIERHPALSSVIASRHDGPVQFFDPGAARVVKFGRTSVAHLTALEMQAVIAEEAERPFDLEVGDVARAHLYTRAVDDHVLLFSCHHIVTDLWSLVIVFKELWMLYDACLSRRTPAMPPRGPDYGDYVVWQRRLLEGNEGRASRAYWMSKLSGELPRLSLMADRSRSSSRTHRGAAHAFTVDTALTGRLKQLARHEKTTLQVVLLSAFAVFLSRCAHQRELMIGIPSAGRLHAAFDGVVGYFVNLLPLRIDLAEDPDFHGVVARVASTVLEALDHQQYPFSRLVEALRPRRDTGRSALLGAMFVLENPHSAADPEMARIVAGVPSGGIRTTHLALEPFPLPEPAAPFDLTLSLTDVDSTLAGKFRYDADLFDEATAREWSTTFLTLLGAITAEPAKRVASLPLLDAARRALVMAQSVGAASDTHFTETVHRQFEACAARHPEDLALTHGAVSLTYRQLDQLANQLAGDLVRLGVGPEKRVALVLKRSERLPMAILAVLKAGGAFVPLDTQSPRERLRYILHDADPMVLLTDEALDGDDVGAGVPRIVLDDLVHATASSEPREVPRVPVLPDGLAYVIYTSGSTGHPKGVQVTHRALSNLVRWYCRAFGVTRSDRASQLANPAFDASLWEMLPALAHGASVHVVPSERLTSTSTLIRWMKAKEITLAFAPTPMAELLIEDGEALQARSLRMLGAGGDRLHRGPKASLPFRFTNVYGPTECTIASTTFDVDAGDDAPPIGRAIAETQTYVLDERLELVPPGVVGVLYIAGVGLARAYHGRAALTAACFVPNPFGGHGARMYRTGDLVRWGEGGNLEFLGRMDTQIKMRGFRIEIGEIEATLQRHETIGQVAVLARSDARAITSLVAFVTAAPSAAQVALPSALRTYLLQRLPEYMVPSTFVVLPALPLSQNGKVDRAALASIDVATEASAHVAPQTEAERALAQIWRELLHLENPGRGDNFFDCGGHSLLATQLVSRVRERFGVDVPLLDVFEAPSLAELARRIEVAERPHPAADRPKPLIVPVRRDRSLPISLAQQRLWFLDQLEPESSSYNMPVALRLSGELDQETLRASLEDVVARHEILRTKFLAQDGVPLQVIAPVGNVPLSVVDLADLAAAASEARLQALAAQAAAAPFDLAHGPLLRATLFRLDREEHVLLLVLHHIVADGWSLHVLAREFSRSYAARDAGQDAPVEPLAIQYADFAVWQRSWFSGAEFERQLQYWVSQVEGWPLTLRLPTDRPRSPARSSRLGHHRFRIGSDLLDRVKHLGRRHGATLHMVVCAAFQTLLYRRSRQEQFLIGTPVANRTCREVEGLIGFFVNTLVVRADLRGAPSFIDHLQAVRATMLSAYAHQDLPFESLVEHLHVLREHNRHPVVQALLVFQNTPLPEVDLPGLTIAEMPIAGPSAKFDLTLTAMEVGDELRCELAYAADLFESATMARLGAELERLLESVVADPTRSVAALPMLPKADRDRVLGEWNDSRESYGGPSCLHHHFEAQVERTPDAVALMYEGANLTYRELDDRANQLARCLETMGVGVGSVVALCVERSFDLMVAILGILKAGAAYSPLDPSYPTDRLTFMLEDAGANVVITQHQLRARLVPGNRRVLSIDSEWSRVAEFPTQRRSSNASADNLAYVIYTSGSTGVPKGVMVSHRSVTNYVRWLVDRFSIGPDDRGMQRIPYSFDMSVKELFPALFAGARIVIAPPDTHADAAFLVNLMAKERITLAYVTPSLLKVMVNEPEFPQCTALRCVMSGGEEMSADLRDRFFHHLDAELINAYGPTEGTVNCASWRCERGRDEPIVPIGVPIPNARTYVLSDRLELVPIGGVGELCIGGVGVAQGYWRRAALTARSFVPDPFSTTPGARLYRTGDLARHRADGALEYLGREDGQIKRMGARIELGEIESVLALHPSVVASAAAVWPGSAGDLLVGYWVEGDVRTDAAELRYFLRERLPAPMVPACLYRLTSLPLTANGKLDRAALPMPDDRDLERTTALAPNTPTEEMLASIWSALLGRKQVRGSDEFFELGGHSLLATQMLSRVRQILGVEIALRTVFDTPVLADLARQIDILSREQLGVVMPPLQVADRTEDPPLSYAQERLWFLDRLDPGGPVYNVPLAVRMHGVLDRRALADSMQTITCRHETLRTSFPDRDGKAIQVIMPPSALTIEEVDFAGVADEERERAVRDFLEAEARRPFDLARGPLLRMHLLAISKDEHVLLAVIHHIISDAWSRGVLLRELSILYAGFAKGETLTLPPLAVQYADFAVWQRECAALPSFQRQVEYWRSQLAGELPILRLPSDRPAPPLRSFDGARYRFVFPAALAEATRSLARSEGATLFMTLLAAFQALLHRYSGEDDILVGSPVANRNHLAIEGLIGFFVNSLVLRTSFADDPSFRDVLRRVRESTLGAFAHQDLPFERLVEILRPTRSLAHTPLFQTMFVLQNAPMSPLELPGLRLEPLDLACGVAKLDLTVVMVESADGSLVGDIEYATTLFEPATLAALADNFRRLLESAVIRPEQRVSRMPLLGGDPATGWPEDDDAAVNHLNHRGPCVIAAFEAQAARSLGRAAVIDAHGATSYRDLDRLANRIAQRLRRLGVGAEVRVGICLSRSAAMVASVLGVLKAGGAYVPLDPGYPPQRLGFLLADADVAVLLVDKSSRDAIPYTGARIVVDDMTVDDTEQEAVVLPRITGEELAYLIYTSGSTGTPNGVGVSRRSLAALVASFEKTLALGPGDRLFMVPSLSFDASVGDLFPALTSGATLVIHPTPNQLSSAELSRECERLGVSVLDIPVALFNQWIEDLAAGDPDSLRPSSLRLVVSGGESITASRLEKWRRVFPERVALLGAYGPTEATVCSAQFTLRSGAALPSGRALPIGRPLTHVTLHVLDRWMQPVPTGVTGELYIGGCGVARGYLGHVRSTAESFVPDSFSSLPGQRLYRTGDATRVLADGTLEFVGRRDHQVKVRGYRVELGEVEHAVRAFQGIRDAAVIARDEGTHKRLVAYVVAERHPPDISALLAFLKTRLPPHAVPASVVVLTALPLSTNGKVDRAALPAPGGERPQLRQAYVAPESDVEQGLAAIWAGVLNLEQVGIHDNFFELGGDSILSVQIVARANQRGWGLKPRHLFEHQTIAELAAIAGTLRPIDAEQGVVSGAMTLSPIQRWFFEHDFGDRNHWNQAVLLEPRAALDSARLAQAAAHVLRHHDVLRSRFHQVDGSWCAVVDDSVAAPAVASIDLSHVPQAERETALSAAIARAQMGLDLVQGPLLAFSLLTDGTSTGQRLLVVVHHLVIDYVSWFILLEDLETAYLELQQGAEAIHLPAKTTSFKAWTARLEAHARSARVVDELRYWLAELPQEVAPLPLDHASAGDNSFASLRTLRGGLDEATTQALLSEVPAAYGTSTEEAMVASLLQVIADWTGGDHVLIDLENHGRESPTDDLDVSRTVGWFTSIFPLSVELARPEDTAALLKVVKDGMRLMPNRGMGYGLLCYLDATGRAARALRRRPSAEVCFNYLGDSGPRERRSDLFCSVQSIRESTHSPKGQRPYVLEVSAGIVSGRLEWTVAYSERLHRVDTIRALDENIGAALQRIIAHCRLPEADSLTPSDFPIADLTARDLEGVLAELAAGAVENEEEE